MEDIKGTLKTFILNEFLPGENPEELTDETPLISGGIIDSIAALNLVEFLEEKYGIKIEAHEVNVDCLDTIQLINELILAKTLG